MWMCGTRIQPYTTSCLSSAWGGL